MAYKRKIITKIEEVFDTYAQAVEFMETYTKQYPTYDLTIEVAPRGVWVIFEPYEWSVTDNDR